MVVTSALVLFAPLLLLIAVILAGVPVAYGMLIAGSIGLYITLGMSGSTGVLVSQFYGLSSFLFATIPMFVLMAMFIKESDIAGDLFNVIYKWTVGFPAALPMTATLANGMMAVLSGSSTASAAAMARIAVPEMRKYGYTDKIAIGTVAASGTFASMLPPSILLIIFGLITQTSVADLFIGGIIPGLLTIVAYAIVLIAWVRMTPPTGGEAEVETFPLSERVRNTRKVWSPVALAVIVLGGIYSGIITPTEAGGIGAAGAFVVGLTKNLGLPDIGTSLEEGVDLTVMIFMLIFAATVFGSYLTTTRLAQDVSSAIANSPLPPLAVVLVVLLIYILLGTMVEGVAAMLMTLPVTYPLIVTNLGYDPIWFGIVIVKTIEIGLVTPPFGLNVFVASGSVDIEPEVAFSGAMRFLVADVVILLLMIAFPQIPTWLPQNL